MISRINLFLGFSSLLNRFEWLYPGTKIYHEKVPEVKTSKRQQVGLKIFKLKQLEKGGNCLCNHQSVHQFRTSTFHKYTKQSTLFSSWQPLRRTVSPWNSSNLQIQACTASLWFISSVANFRNHLAIKVLFAIHRAVVLPTRLLQFDADPNPSGKFRRTNEPNETFPRLWNKHSEMETWECKKVVVSQYATTVNCILTRIERKSFANTFSTI